MKKLIIIAGALILSATAMAQQTKEATAVLKKIEKSNATIADAKKAASVNAWIERGNVMTDAAIVYTSKLISDLPVAQMTAPNMLGNPRDIEEVQIAGALTNKYVYDKFDMYVSEDGNVLYWESKEEVYPKAFFEALAALTKAKEISAKDFAKGGRGAQAADRLMTEMTINGRNLYMLSKFAPAGEVFTGAFQAAALKGTLDTISLYYSGISFFEGKEYEKSLAVFEKMLSIGSLQNGLTYNYLASSYDKLGQKDKAIETFETGFNAFPQNASIMGGLINAYMAAEKSPEKLIELIKRAQEIDPKNISLYMVESQIWDKIGNRTKALTAIDKAIAIDPTSFDSYYNYAILSLMESDAIVETANKLDINDTKNYDRMMEEVKVHRLKAVEMFEKARSINPESTDLIEILRQVYFACRDYSPEIQAKYDKLNAEHPAK